MKKSGYGLLLLLIIVSACSSENGFSDWDSLEDEEVMGVLIAEARCAAVWDCADGDREVARDLQRNTIARFTFKEDCVETIAEQVRQGRIPQPQSRRQEAAAFDAGRIELDRSKIDDCRDALREAFCSGERQQDLGLHTCAADVGLYLPQRGDGDHCALDAECIGESLCAPVEGECYGRCTEIDGGTSQPCSRDAHCGEDHYCASTPGQSRSCQPRLSVGESCSTGPACEIGTTCRIENPVTDEGSCQPLGQQGENCDDDTNCESHLVCAASQCQPINLVEEGGQCTLSLVALCAPGTVCVGGGQGGQCVPIGGEGDPCHSNDLCQYDLYCNGDGHCAAPADHGEPCDDSSGCADGYCDRQTDRCEPAKGEGASCRSEAECRAPYFCDMPMYGLIYYDDDDDSSDGICTAGFTRSLCELPGE